MKKSSTAVFFVYVFMYITVAANAAASLLAGNYRGVLGCAAALALFLMPWLLRGGFGIELPDPLELCVLLFVFASTFLGEVRDCYVRFPLWDSALHLTSGFLTTATGLSLIDIMNRSERTKFTLSPGFAALFAFCFSMTTEVMWELCEFASDMLLHTDMQKDSIVLTVTSALLGVDELPVESAILNGMELDGWLDIGLIDTMKDLMLNAVGSLIFSVFGVFYLKRREAGWVTRFMPVRRKNGKKNE